MNPTERHILIVEDEMGIIQFLSQGLQEEGYKVDFATDGVAGFEKFNQNKYDLILLDWMLPKMTGVALCNKIRSTNESIPIIFLTAKDTIQETIEGLKSGANDYVKKPFNFEELLARINVQFRNKEEQKDTLTLGNFTIFIQQRKVYHFQEEIVLTTREFDLLFYLIKNKGKVCSRANIIAEVWNIHFEYDDSVIDVFMNAIRKKLKITKEMNIIKTIRGVGFMADDE